MPRRSTRPERSTIHPLDDQGRRGFAATRGGSIAAGLPDRIGTITEGKAADLVLLQANPLDDIRNIRRIEHVIARGRIVDTEALPEHPLFLVTVPAPSQGN